MSWTGRLRNVFGIRCEGESRRALMTSPQNTSDFIRIESAIVTLQRRQDHLFRELNALFPLPNGQSWVLYGTRIVQVTLEPGPHDSSESG